MKSTAANKTLRDFIRESIEDLFVMDDAQNVVRLSRNSVDDQYNT